MKSGFEIVWSESAYLHLEQIFSFLQSNWTEREIRNFAKRLDKRLEIISKHPRIFPKSNNRKTVRRSVLKPHSIIHYTFKKNIVTIVSIFDSRRDPR